MSDQVDYKVEPRLVVERFEEVAMSFSDDEIRGIIKEALKEQIKDQVDFGTVIKEWTDFWLEDENNCDFVMKCLKDSIANKFK